LATSSSEKSGGFVIHDGVARAGDRVSDRDRGDARQEELRLAVADEYGTSISNVTVNRRHPCC
jgi:hypothetical protein